MGDEERSHAGAAVQAQDLLADDDGGEGVQLAGGFIIEDELGLDDEGAGDGGAFFHAAGEFGGRLVDGVGEADIRQFLPHDGADLLRRFQPVFAEVEAHVFADGQGAQEGAGLEDEGHAVFGGDLRAGDGFAVDQDLAGIGRLEADEMFEQHALAAAAGPHDDEDLAGFDIEVEALEDFLSVKTLAQAAHHEADSGGCAVGGVHLCRIRVRSSVRM